MRAIFGVRDRAITGAPRIVDVEHTAPLPPATDDARWLRESMS